ncbi:DUF2510 domain-containing protein [Streptomyces purpurogeneiscleroticus]|uniref:DUF2510 domain-containing protein n=1 Tax=Streptomyces purpurogeneiscleroticus TaxID=68259 RepID=UPI001CBC78FD|nr:DUF2510 domain-containing protein [Streptomyces purpurogeneiscleroticus]MBZ4018457.1 hypothetical protein [Streptomyces purpurogeneiscleroticus]
MTTPPGWYPDPGHTGNGPAPERWWDGSAWTEHTRAAGTAPAAYGYPQQGTPGAYGYPQQQPGGPGQGGGRKRGPVIAAVAGAVAVVAAAGIVLAVTLGGGDEPRADPKPTAPAKKTPSPEPATTSAAPEPAPTDDEDTLVDALNSIAIPVLDGWHKDDFGNDIDMYTGPYMCKGEDSKQCLRGKVLSETAAGFSETTAKGIAEADIEKNVEATYGKGSYGDKDRYGGIENHEELKSEKVTVAGRKGHLVRWKVTNKKGPDGIAQSVAFPSPGGSGSMVVVRFNFDVGGQAPPLADMDKILEGIKPTV